MLFDDVVVVQKPIAGGTDILTKIGALGQAPVDGFEVAAGAVEAPEKGGGAPAGPGWSDPLRAGRDAGSIVKVFGSKKFPSDRPDQDLVAGVA
ncbi:MAG: hypothetical protein IT352_08140 [Gemmatimonadales bacterium]|nr:hypothetical protein [Gemmatimonadales bacterium]